jgi:hypothetical protein
MDTALHSDVAWLLTLRAAERARFLALLAHELTVYGRVLPLEQLRQLNEIQHQVCGHIGHALGPDDDVALLSLFARHLLEHRDPRLREFAIFAWTSARKCFAPAYKELYPAGTEVRVVPREKLEDFRRTWRYHHALEDGQLPYAGGMARVASVGFYHGGDVLYTLENIPGIWHEVCLESAILPYAVT